MADPISLAAIAGLVFAGRSLSTKSEPEPVQKTETITPQQPQEPQITYDDDVPEFIERGFEPRVEIPQKREMEK